MFGVGLGYVVVSETLIFTRTSSPEVQNQYGKNLMKITLLLYSIA